MPVQEAHRVGLQLEQVLPENKFRRSRPSLPRMVATTQGSDRTYHEGPKRIDRGFGCHAARFAARPCKLGLVVC